MLTEFVSVQLSREEVQILHAGLLQRALLEDELRGSRGKKSSELLDLLAKFEMLLGESEETLHQLDHQLHDQLWEYAQSVFIEEWARFRARQEVERELQVAQQQLALSAVNKLVDMQYRKHFDRFVAELDMDEVKKIQTSLKQTS